MSNDEKPLLTRRETVLAALAKHMAILDEPELVSTIIPDVHNFRVMARRNVYRLSDLLPGDCFFFCNHRRVYGLCYIVSVRAIKTVNSITFRSFELGNFTIPKSSTVFNWSVQILKPSKFTTNDLKK